MHTSAFPHRAGPALGGRALALLATTLVLLTGRVVPAFGHETLPLDAPKPQRAPMGGNSWSNVDEHIWAQPHLPAALKTDVKGLWLKTQHNKGMVGHHRAHVESHGHGAHHAPTLISLTTTWLV